MQTIQLGNVFAERYLMLIRQNPFSSKFVNCFHCNIKYFITKLVLLVYSYTTYQAHLKLV